MEHAVKFLYSVMLQLDLHDFYSTVLKTKHKLYIATGLTSQQLNESSLNPTDKLNSKAISNNKGNDASQTRNSQYLNIYHQTLED